MEKNDIVSVVTVAGEFVGKFQSDVDGIIEINDPRMIVQGPEGQMGFAHGVCSTGKHEPDSIRMSYIFNTPTSPEVEKGYREFTSGIILK
jgi:hypothetical protein